MPIHAGVGAVEVEAAPGQVLGAASIRQAMADAKLYAPSTCFGCMVEPMWLVLVYDWTRHLKPHMYKSDVSCAHLHLEPVCRVGPFCA